MFGRVDESVRRVTSCLLTGRLIVMPFETKEIAAFAPGVIVSTCLTTACHT